MRRVRICAPNVLAMSKKYLDFAHKIPQWNLLSYVANMVSIVVLCTHRQTVFQIAKCQHSINNKKGGRVV